MSLTLTREEEAVIQRMLATGRFKDPREVVHAGLKRLEAESTDGIERFPAGSLAHFFSKENNEEELALAKGSSLRVEE